MADMVLVYTTWPTLESAQEGAGALIEHRLVACANMLPGMLALYRWEGKVTRGEEVAMLLKTRAALVPALEAAFLTLHPYETPAFIVVPAAHVAAGYLAWLEGETGV